MANATLSSLESRTALDVCCHAVQAAGATTPLLLTGSAYYAADLLHRLRHTPPLLLPTGGQPAATVQPAAGWHPAPAALISSSDVTTPHRAIVWAEPEAPDAAALAAQLPAWLAPDGLLCIVLSGVLARQRLGEWQRDPRPATAPLALRAVRGLLRQHGLRVVAHHRVHGAVALLANGLMHAATIARRPDLADRLRALKYAALVAPGVVPQPTAMHVLLAQPGHAG